MPTYVLGLVVVALVDTSRRSHRDSMRLAELSGQLANARMATLSAQLHPHFLFNSLNAVAGLIVDKPYQAVEMVARLGDFLRVALEGTKRPWTTVAEEMSGLEAYLALQQSRFHDRLQVTLTVDPQALKARIPALLMQPVVENAIEHGLARPGQSLAVAVTIAPIARRLHIVVTNSTPTIPNLLDPQSYGDGLRNVAARLQTAFAGDALLSVGPHSPGGTRAELIMPLNVDGDADGRDSIA
jgi:two-component system LytT family sensor kinase